MVSVLDAARYFIYLSYKSNSALTHLKLQKLLYLAQGWSFVWDDKSLFSENFEAWQYGPVNIKVYNHFRKYSRDIIPETEGMDSLGDSDAESTIQAVWKNYYNYSTFDLVEITHNQEPWKKAYPSRATINNEDIKSYFKLTYC